MRLSSANDLPRSYSLEMLPSELLSSPRSPSSPSDDVQMEESHINPPERVNKHAIDFLIGDSRALISDSSSTESMDIAPLEAAIEKFSPRGWTPQPSKNLIRSASGGSKPSNFSPLTPSFSSSINKSSKMRDRNVAKSNRKARLPSSASESSLPQLKNFNIVSLPVTQNPINLSLNTQVQTQQQQQQQTQAQPQLQTHTKLKSQRSPPLSSSSDAILLSEFSNSPRTSLRSVPKSMTFPFPQQVGVSTPPSHQYPSGVSSMFPSYVPQQGERHQTIPQSPFDHIQHLEQFDQYKRERERSNTLYEAPNYLLPNISSYLQSQQQNQQKIQESATPSKQSTPNSFPFQFSPSKLNTPGTPNQIFTPENTNNVLPRIETNVVLNLVPPVHPLTSTEDKVTHYMSQIRAQTYCTVLPIADILKKEDKKIMCPFGGGCSKKIKGKGNLRRHMEWHLRKIEDDIRRNFGEKEGENTNSSTPQPSADTQNEKSSPNWVPTRKTKGSFLFSSP